jgi:2,4-dienoyl-CoA reductase-like NADH-dependent reductase (Old Yellow Enzyme family)/thioredoxin reductase
MTELKKLFEPIKVGNLLLKNRIVMAPLACSFASAEGEITDTMCNYFSARAKGGAAMIAVGVCLVDLQGRLGPGQPRIDDDRFIPGFYRLVRGVRENGALTCAQLHHAGRFAVVEEPVSASDVPPPWMLNIWKDPRPLTTKEVEELVDRFGNAAVRAQRAGFDMVELHGATGYLITQFVSPRTNKRTDRYGGCFDNRIRFPLDIIQNIRKKCGPNFPIGIRMIGDEWLPDGFQLDEALLFAQRLEAAGVAYISASAGTYESFPLNGGYLAMGAPKGKTIKYGAEIKKNVNIPVFINGKIADPIWMDQLLTEGQGDVIALGRPLVSDPDLPIKAQEGRLEDIRKCNSCCYCLDTFMRNLPLECFQNADVGREAEYRIRPAEKRKKVLIVGGGPGGLEAARVAALRGHDVTLMEKQSDLGGQLLLAAIPTGKEEYKTATVDWLVTQCKKAGVKIELNKRVDSEVVAQVKPDVLVVATGGNPLIPPIPGADSQNVMTYEKALRYEGDWGSKKVVVVGGGDVGSEIAEFLARKGANICIVEMLPELALAMEVQNRILLLTRLAELRVDIKTHHLVEAIEKDGVVVVNLQTREKKTIKADLVVMALGVTPNKDLENTIKGKAKETYFIGDCVAPRKAVNAIHQASFIARQI